MNLYHYYMHKDSKDIAIQPIEFETPVRVHAHIWNLGYSGSPWMIDSGIFTIKNQSEWIDISERFHDKRMRDGIPRG